MGLFFLDTSTSVNLRERRELEYWHHKQCTACPLRDRPGDIPATGAERPLIYCIGEAAGATEARKRSQFVGKSGMLLRPRIPERLASKVRWNNVVRSHPENNKTPEQPEIECCRPSVAADIERSRPVAIFGFGNVPLNWICGFNGISIWRGRRMPVKVGKHTCWYYPMLHPSGVLRGRRQEDKNITDPDFIGTEDERMFIFDLEQAIAEVEFGLPEPVVHDKDMIQSDIKIVTECNARALREIEVFLASAAKEPIIGFDYETHRLRPYAADAKVLTAAVAARFGTLAFPFDHPQATWSKAHRADLDELWYAFLKHCKARKAAHNVAFEMEWTAVKWGAELLRCGQWECTSIQANVIDERTGKLKPGPFSLEHLVQQYFGFNIKALANIDRDNLMAYALERVLRYNGPDAKYHLKLFEEQKLIIEAEKLQEVYELSVRRAPTCILAQVKGVPVNQDIVVELQNKYQKQIKAVERKIADLEIAAEFEQKYKKRERFNPHSNKHVLYVFHDMLKRDECRIFDKKQKKERLSVDELVLEQIDHPLSRLIIDLRKARKSKSTYIDPLEEGGATSVLWPDGLLHCQYNTHFPETGRLSCEEPNLQNFPKREDQLKELRRPVRAARDCVMLSFDYGQIEARVIAMFTKDKAYVKALWDNFDVHMDWAERIAHAYPARIGGKRMLTDEKAMKDFRTDIKNQWTFPLFFGARLESAAGYLSMPVDKVRPHFNAFWKQFQETKVWQDKVLRFYHKYGYVECLTGRRRHGPLSINKVFNTPVQGTAADIVCDAMCRLSESGDPELQPEIQVHDDLTFLRVAADRWEAVAERVISMLLDVRFPWVNVPITIEMSKGLNWQPYDKISNPDGMKEFGTFASDTWFK